MDHDHIPIAVSGKADLESIPDHSANSSFPESLLAADCVNVKGIDGSVGGPACEVGALAVEKPNCHYTIRTAAGSINSAGNSHEVSFTSFERNSKLLPDSISVMKNTVAVGTHHSKFSGYVGGTVESRDSIGPQGLVPIIDMSAGCSPKRCKVSACLTRMRTERRVIYQITIVVRGAVLRPCLQAKCKDCKWKKDVF